MSSLITQVRAKLFLHSTQKSMHALDGAYASLLRGRSLDFEDLRPYEYGDQVRDIDWRATARHGDPVIRRTRATRRHTVLFVVDSGRGMRALAEDERPKSELLMLLVGALGWLTVRHGDDFSVVHGDARRVHRLAPAGSEGALEHALRALTRSVRESTAPCDRDALLGYVAHRIARRAIVVIVTDEAPVTEEAERMLRRLRVQHDVLWLTVRDAVPVRTGPFDGRTDPGGARPFDRLRDPGETGPFDAHAPLEPPLRVGRSLRGAGPRRRNPVRARRDVDSDWLVPDFVHGDRAVLAELAAQETADVARRDALLRRLGISHAEFGAQHSAIPALLAMLERRSHARP